MRSLLNSEGPIETARQGREVAQAEDRRVDLVVRELSRYDVKVAALQETKRFGSGVYQVGENIILAAGKPVPELGEPVQRGEGMIPMLIDVAVRASKAAGGQWKMKSLQLVSAQLQNCVAGSSEENWTRKRQVCGWEIPSWCGSIVVLRRALGA